MRSNTLILEPEKAVEAGVVAIVTGVATWALTYFRSIAGKVDRVEYEKLIEEMKKRDAEIEGRFKAVELTIADIPRRGEVKTELVDLRRELSAQISEIKLELREQSRAILSRLA